MSSDTLRSELAANYPFIDPNKNDSGDRSQA